MTEKKGIMNEIHDIMSASDENACLHAFEERRMPIMSFAHDIMSASDENASRHEWEDVSKYALWLWNVPDMNSAKIESLMADGASACDIYNWDEKAILDCGGLSIKDAAAITESRRTWSLDGEWARLLEKGISFVSMEQAEYPKRLRSIIHPPYGLYYRGNLPDAQQKAVGIVGARSRSEYGRMTARRMGEVLAKSGVTVISGLARGIDADGHIGALDGGGQTFAVLGCGVDICYPRTNRYLYDRILDNGGGILSEYPPGREAVAWQFPMRNRIISGLSDCVVVVEAKKRSGSLITADYAMEQGRDVYAVPGRIADPLSEGTNLLIHQGAGVYVNESEFLKDLHLQGTLLSEINFRKKTLEKDESLVYSLLDFAPVGLGTLVEKSAMPLNQLLAVLASLEEKGYIEESVPNYYVRKL